MGSYGGGIPTFSYHLTPWVKKLIIVNVVAFLVTVVVGLNTMVDWFAFQPQRVLIRPWGAVTYMFIHGGPWHLFFNMAFLFFFGPPLESRWGSREFVQYYLVCGLGGVGLSFLFASANIIGASAAVFGILLAFAMVWPTAPIYVWGIFPVQARVLVAFLGLVAFMSAFDGGGGGGVAHLAHLGGLVTGFIYLKSDWRASEKLQKFANAARNARRLAIVPREGPSRASAGRSQKADATRSDDKAVLDAVDQVLDKISAHGMSSLTDEERRLLDEVSRSRRMN